MPDQSFLVLMREESGSRAVSAAARKRPAGQNPGGERGGHDSLHTGGLELSDRVVQAFDDCVASSDDFWERITGIPDFPAQLLRASTILAWLVKRRSQDEVARIKAEAIQLFGDPFVECVNGSHGEHAVARGAFASRSHR